MNVDKVIFLGSGISKKIIECVVKDMREQIKKGGKK